MKNRKGSNLRLGLSILLTGAFLFLLAMSVSAQLPTGTILGVVKDSSGAVVPGANVTIQSSETNQTRHMVTDSGGAYRVPALPVGHYDVKVEQTGFKTETQTGLNLEVGQEAVVDFALQVGSAEQQVQVTGEAQQVNTTNSTLGSVVSEQTMTDLPLNGRNYNDLTLLQPGITQHKGLTNAGGKQPGTIFSSNGAGYQSNSYLLDGASMISLYAVSAASGTGSTLGVDGIREYKVVTNNLGAEYGVTMGAQTLLVSKSGTNSLHGDGFEFLRNSALDAANYFDTPQSSGASPDGAQHRLPEFRRNNFGGSLGGAVKKDKTFFHVAYEALRESIGQTIVSGTVPLNCLPVSAGGTATITNDPCATASTPKLSVNAAAWTILGLFPKPNLPAGCLSTNAPLAGCQVTYPHSEPVSENWGQGRLDHTFSASDSAFARYTFDDSYVSFGLGYQPFTQSEPTRSQFTTLAENHVFSPSLLNSARFSFSRTAAHINSPSNIGPYNINMLPGQAIPGLGTFQITGVTTSTQGGGFGPGSTLPTYATQDIFTWSDDLFWEKGKHSLKFGTLVNYYQQDMFNQNPARGAFTNGSLAEFLSGTLKTVQTNVLPTQADAYRHYRFDTIGFYGQDDYKILPTLTLNLGLRYEFATVEKDRDGMDTNGNPTCTYPCVQIQPMYKNPYLHNFGPRVGFAWDVFGNGKTSLRGGGGLLYDVANLAENINGSVGTTPPFGNQISLSAPLTNITIPLNLSGAGGSSSAESHPTSGISTNLRAPKMYQWNLTVERQLPWAMALELSYVGSRGIHLLQSSDQNPWPFTLQNGQPVWPAYVANNTNPDGSCKTGFVCRLVAPSWGAFSTVQGNGDSHYNALEVNVTKRVSRGFQFQSSYTYSKLIDDGDGVAPSQATGTSNQTISILDEKLDRGLASYDVRNNYHFNAIYYVPKMNSSNRFVNGLANGWWGAAIFAVENGYPFTPSISSNRSQSRTSSSNPSNLDRPDWAPGRNPYNATHGGSSGCTEGSGTTAVAIPAGTPLGAPTLYLDPCAFLLAPIGYEGNVGRNSVIGPGLMNLDFSLVKDTKVKWLGEAGNAQFRAEFFNIMNHPNFAQPTNRTIFAGSSTATCAITGCLVENPTTGIGVIQSTANGTNSPQASGGSRQIQFGLKVSF